jgi:hypothetical protein
LVICASTGPFPCARFLCGLFSVAPGHYTENSPVLFVNIAFDSYIHN